MTINEDILNKDAAKSKQIITQKSANQITTVGKPIEIVQNFAFPSESARGLLTKLENIMNINFNDPMQLKMHLQAMGFYYYD